MSGAEKKEDLQIVFKPGSIIFKEGDAGDCLYVVLAGQIEVHKLGRDGQKIPLAIVNSGQCLGEFSALDGKKRSATAIALTEVKTMRVTAQALELQLSRIPSWLKTIMINLVDRLRATDEVLRRNSIVDEQLHTQIAAARAKAGLTGSPSGKSS